MTRLRMICLAAVMAAAGFAMADTGHVEIAVVDEAGQPLPCRIHLYDGAGKPQQAEGLPFWRDHFVCPGNVKLELPPGAYRYEIERGPEHEQGAGSFELAQGETERVSVALGRIADLAAEGWYSGDLHVHRALEDMPLLMEAEDLYVAPVITWWNNSNLWTKRELPEDPLVRLDGSRYYHVMAGEDEREGGALMYFGRTRPLAIAGSTREYPSPMKFVDKARAEGGVWIDVEKPFWWDVPIWLASGKVDSVGLANNHMCRSRMYESEAWGRPRDESRLPPPRGNGFWTQAIYYHLLNCGLRVPPSAGSASGVLPNPLGYDRVYVHCGEDFTYESWWQGLKAGRSFVTNGPLLVVKANGHLPGHVFTAGEGGEVKIEIRMELTTRDPVSAVEIVQNGHSLGPIPVKQLKVPGTRPRYAGSLGTLGLRHSGWFLVRAIADVDHTFRFASSAPFYVEIAPTKRRVWRHSAQFFLDWVDERAKRVPFKLDDPEKLREVLAYHDEARRFWEEKVAGANAE